MNDSLNVDDPQASARAQIKERLRIRRECERERLEWNAFDNLVSGKDRELLNWVQEHYVDRLAEALRDTEHDDHYTAHDFFLDAAKAYGASLSNAFLDEMHDEYIGRGGGAL